VKLHGGAIWAESVHGQGTTFHVAVPLGHAHLPADHLRARRTLADTNTRAEAFVTDAEGWLPDGDAPPAVVEGSSDLPALLAGLSQGGRVPRVLVVDDNADLRDYIRRILASAHYNIETVRDGSAALAMARQPDPPDLVLSDVMMPRLDGFGLVRALREDPRTEAIPVILLSARAGEEARIEGLAADADDYLVKPFNGREIVARVEGACAWRKRGGRRHALSACSLRMRLR
jgi:CheY-like chemotaxis protein